MVSSKQFQEIGKPAGDANSGTKTDKKFPGGTGKVQGKDAFKRLEALVYLYYPKL